MSLVINHNLMAMNAQRNLSDHYGRLGVSTRRLSSGLRVGTAADDAAGLAIRELMRSEISSLHQGVRNASDAISLIQTADGALQVIDEKLIRMKELAMQASTGTYNSDQRLIIDSEYQAMSSEITRIANATDFNGIYLLNGNLAGDPAVDHDGTGLQSTGPLKIHFGTGNDSAEDYYYVAIQGSTASAFGLGHSAAIDNDCHRMGSTKRRVAPFPHRGWLSRPWKRSTRRSFPRTRFAPTSVPCRTAWKTPSPTCRIQAENLQSAESRISDVDVAQEMTEFVRNQILTQSAVAMLAQANSLPRMAMQLIGG